MDEELSDEDTDVLLSHFDLDSTARGLGHDLAVSAIRQVRSKLLGARDRGADRCDIGEL